MIKTFHKKSIAFWFVLLMIALVNAVVRETTYKPLLTPLIGMWAHQISTVTAIVLFFIAIYIFLKNIKEKFSQKDLVISGFIWLTMTLIFETIMNRFIRNLSFEEIIQTYYFWKGETWIFVLISLLISPQVALKILKNSDNKK
jgi:4-amino-4-deoxy-L-arabinose transferase-like glycosyltransferase